MMLICQLAGGWINYVLLSPAFCRPMDGSEGWYIGSQLQLYNFLYRNKRGDQ